MSNVIIDWFEEEEPLDLLETMILIHDQDGIAKFSQREFARWLKYGPGNWLCTNVVISQLIRHGSLH